MEVMFSNSINEGYFNNKKFVGLIGDETDIRLLVNDIEEVNLKANKKVKNIINNYEFFDILGLDDSILKKKIKDLSYSEYKLILLVKICNMNNKVIILNNFDLGFNYKDRSKISKYIKIINATYKTNFIIISNNILFINKCAKYIIITKNKIIKYQGDIISAIKNDLIDKPEIIKFIDMANKKGAELDYTLDYKELLKAIYRSVF